MTQEQLAEKMYPMPIRGLMDFEMIESNRQSDYDIDCLVTHAQRAAFISGYNKGTEGSCRWVEVKSEKDLPEAGIKVPWKYKYTGQPIQYSVGGRGGLKDHLPIIQSGEIHIWWLSESSPSESEHYIHNSDTFRISNGKAYLLKSGTTDWVELVPKEK